MYAFLQLFFTKYSKYASLPFHIAAESYGGRYAPLFADKIWQENKKLSLSRYAAGAMVPKHINLESILLGNGLTEPQTQFASVPDFACRGPYAIFEPDSATCQTLDSKAETCAKMIGACYSTNSRLACLPANLFCWSSLYSDAQRTGLNLYDVRKKWCVKTSSRDYSAREVLTPLPPLTQRQEPRRRRTPLLPRRGVRSEVHEPPFDQGSLLGTTRDRVRGLQHGGQPG